MQRFTKGAWRAAGLLLVAVLASMTGLRALAAEEEKQDAGKTAAADTPQYAYVADQSVYFYDVAADYPWAFHEIDYLATLSVVNGTGDYLFEPEERISRADFVLMLYRAYDMGKYAEGENFPDVPQGTYYYNAVLAAKKLGITAGDNGNFLPEASVTREDAMLFLMRTIARAGIEPEAASLSRFADGDMVSDYARDAVARLVGAGVIGGDKENRITPQEYVTRAEMSVMLYRAMMIEKGEQGTHYVAHPERINLCIGDQLYPSVIIAEYDSNKTYSGLMELVSFEQENGRRTVRLGAPKAIDQQIIFQNGKLTVGDKTLPLAANAVSIQVAPYCALQDFQTTGDEYAFGMPSVNAKGEVTVVYYQRK